jgi:hypothetical protein
MPSSTMREESEYRLPENTPFPAQLKSVDVRTIKYQRDGKDKQFDKWEWVFEITEGEYAGMEAYGESEDRLTNHPDNKVRQWAETLRDAPFGIGEGLNTDDLLGLPCVITVFHGDPRPKKDGTNFYPCPVQDVFPEGTEAGQFDRGGFEEPPF